MNIRIIAILLGLVAVIAGISFLVSRQVAAPQSGSLRVTASFYPLWYLASEIAGEQADVAYITPAGAEPHDYEPTPQDLARIETSDLLVLNGGGLEAWSENVLQNLDGATRVVTAGDGLATQEIDEEGATITDPHVWLSPQLAGQMVDRILEGLVAADPSHEETYRANASALRARLAALDASYRTGLATCARKDVITAHAAFGYLASTYGLNQMPIAGLTPDAEPSPQQLAELARFARANQVTHIFFESLVSPRLAETLAGEIGARTLVLNPLEGLTDEEQAAGEDYFTAMEGNLENLRVALSCT